MYIFPLLMYRFKSPYSLKIKMGVCSAPNRSMSWTLVEVWEDKNEHIGKRAEDGEKPFLKDLPGSAWFIYGTFTCSSPQTSNLFHLFIFFFFRSSSLCWLPLHVFFCFFSSPPPPPHSSSSSSSPPAGLCEQSLFSFLFSSFSSSWNSVLIYVHINYFSFVISSVGHDTILWARVHTPRPLLC